MFDDSNQNNKPPSNLPTEPVDIFAGVEKGGGTVLAPTGAVQPQPPVKDALDAGLLKKVESSTTPIAPNNFSGQPATYQVKEPVLGKIILVIVLIVVAGGLVYGGWMVYKYLNAPPATPLVKTPTTTPVTKEDNQNTPLGEDQIVAPTTTESTTPPVVEVPTTTATSNISVDMANDKLLFGQPVDSDKDGLPDSMETQLGTDPNNVDSDKDGLSDGDEVVIWRTNPLNPDTDGDSYKDGEEVKNGYNPVGPGKLITTNTTTQSGTTTKK